MKENINFKASIMAPDTKEVNYWIDLQEDPQGGVIKYYNGNNWVNIIPEEPSAQILSKIEDIDTLDTKLTNMVNQTTTDLNAIRTEINQIKQRISNLEAV